MLLPRKMLNLPADVAICSSSRTSVDKRGSTRPLLCRIVTATFAKLSNSAGSSSSPIFLTALCFVHAVTQSSVPADEKEKHKRKVARKKRHKLAVVCIAVHPVLGVPHNICRHRACCCRCYVAQRLRGHDWLCWTRDLWVCGPSSLLHRVVQIEFHTESCACACLPSRSWCFCCCCCCRCCSIGTDLNSGFIGVCFALLMHRCVRQSRLLVFIRRFKHWRRDCGPHLDQSVARKTEAECVLR